MTDSMFARSRILDALDRAGARYHTFTHRPVMNSHDDADPGA